MSSKLKTVDELKAITASARANGKKIVFTNGCFDLLHRGHVQVLRQSKALGDVLIVGLNSDRSAAAIKGRGRPVLSETDRVELIGAMEMVDYVVLFDEREPSALISTLRPDVLTKGGDWGPDRVVGADAVRSYGGQVVLIPYLQGFSTTEIIDKIRS